MRGSDLQGRLVRAEDGKPLGRIVELHVKEGELVSIVYGPRGLLQRFMASRGGHRVAWSAVVKVTVGAVVIRAPGRS